MLTQSSLSLLDSRRETHQKSPVQLSQRTSPRSAFEINQSFANHTRRSFSFYNDPPGYGQQPNMGAPAYTVYGEEIAFTLKAIPPEFRALPSGTVILDASKRGRLLLEWTPLASGHDDDNGYGSGNKRYRWDASTRFALTAEEAGSLLAKLDRGDPSVELSRRLSGENLHKVFIAKPIELKDQKNDGVSLLVDYVDPDNHQLGQVPHPQRGSGGEAGGAFGDAGLVSYSAQQSLQVLKLHINFHLPYFFRVLDD